MKCVFFSINRGFSLGFSLNRDYHTCLCEPARVFASTDCYKPLCCCFTSSELTCPHSLVSTVSNVSSDIFYPIMSHKSILSTSAYHFTALDKTLMQSCCSRTLHDCRPSQCARKIGPIFKIVPTFISAVHHSLKKQNAICLSRQIKADTRRTEIDADFLSPVGPFTSTH